jgi:hypothetical protein
MWMPKWEWKRGPLDGEVVLREEAIFALGTATLPTRHGRSTVNVFKESYPKLNIINAMLRY